MTIKHAKQTCLWLMLLTLITACTNQRNLHQNYTQPIPNSKLPLEMIAIPGGTFLMGSPPNQTGRKPDEGPQIKVKIEPFWMGKYEITQAQFAGYIELRNRNWDGRYNLKRTPDNAYDTISLPSPRYAQEAVPIINTLGRGDRYPVTGASRYAASQYCKWLSKKTGHFYRLPTEAEWEYACKAGTATTYSFGDDIQKLSEYAWFYDNSEKGDSLENAYRKVGLKKPNAWGLYDMHGNAAEWVLDVYDAKRYEKEKSGVHSENFVFSKTIYPGVLRGGSFEHDPEDLRSASRTKVTHELNLYDCALPASIWWLSAGYHVGFRVVSPVKQPSKQEQQRYWDALDNQRIQEILEKFEGRSYTGMVKKKFPHIANRQPNPPKPKKNASQHR